MKLFSSARHLLSLTALVALAACSNSPANNSSGNTASNTAAGTEAEAVAKALNLSGHLEGGYFRRTYQSDDRPRVTLPGTEGTEGERYMLTSIFYMLTSQSPIGHMHLNKSDIVHYYHLGDPLLYTMIYPDGRLEQVVMGSDPTKGQLLQLTVKGDVWKTSQLLPGTHGYGLISEAVAPGFDYADMTLGTEDMMRSQFPQHWQAIKHSIQKPQ